MPSKITSGKHMAQMVRKQIYIQKRQEGILKKLAREKQVSEAELIREAIDLQIRNPDTVSPPPDSAAWDRALSFMQTLRRRGPASNRRRTWKREDAYETRTNRYGRHSH